MARGCLFALLAVVSFQLAYWFDACPWFMALFLYSLFRLAALSPDGKAVPVPYDNTFESRLAGLISGKQAAAFGLVIGLACYVPHLIFFWTIYGPSAITLWIILAGWVALFLFAGRACLVRFGHIVWAFAAPFLWTGLEYYRSEFFGLRFTWLSAGYAFSNSASLPFMAGFGSLRHWLYVHGMVGLRGHGGMQLTPSSAWSSVWRWRSSPPCPIGCPPTKSETSNP